MIGRYSSNDATVLVLDGYAEGYLIKQGGRIKTWRKRYFVFHDGCLSYRKDSRDNSKVLRRDFVVDVHYYSKVRNGLCVLLKSGRVLYMAAKTEDQANTWYDVFSDYIFQRRKINELKQVYRRRCEHLDPIKEYDDVLLSEFDEDEMTMLSDTDSESDHWVYDF